MFSKGGGQYTSKTVHEVLYSCQTLFFGWGIHFLKVSGHHVMIFLWLHVLLSAADTQTDDKFTYFTHFAMKKTWFSKLFALYSLRSL